MAVIENERDKILQAADPRVIPIPIPIENVDGLGDKLDDIDDAIDEVQQNVDNVLTNTKDIGIRASTLNLTPSNSTTLTAIRKNGLTGSVSWSLFAGSAVLTSTGDTCTIDGNSVTSASITVKASVGLKEAFVTITKLGVLSTEDKVNLSTQVTGALANDNVSGLGALALLNSVDINTQTVGALNFGGGKLTGFGTLAGKNTASANSDVTGLGSLALQNQVNLGTQVIGSLSTGYVSGLGTLATQNTVNASTQVTNLGTLAFANAIAANQIGAGQLAAGVIYAGSITANQVTAGTMSGVSIQSAAYLGVGGTDIASSEAWFSEGYARIEPLVGCTVGVSGAGGTCGFSFAATNITGLGGSLKLKLLEAGGGTYEYSSFSASSNKLTTRDGPATLTLENTVGPTLRLIPSDRLYTSHPNGTIVFHPTYGLMFVKDGVRYICSTTALP